MSQAAVGRPSVISLWGAGVGVLVVVSVAMAVLAGVQHTALDALPAFGRVALIVVLSLVPAAAWLAVIVYQDRQAPEPRSFVIGLFVAGLALAGGIVAPLTAALQLSQWGALGTLAGAAAGFVHGAVAAAAIYAVVRWTVLPTADFDQYLDGVVYAVAVAMGMATADGMALLLSRDTRVLGAALSAVTVDVLLLLAVGTLVGHLLSAIKLHGTGRWSAVLAVVGGGLVLAAGDVLDAYLPTSATGTVGWQALLPAALVMVVVLGVVTVLVQRAPAEDRTPAARGAVDQGDVAVLGAVLVVLAAGALLQGQWLGARRSVTQGTLTLSVPAGLLPVRPGAAYPARDRAGVEYRLAERPSTGDAAVDVTRESTDLGAACHVYAPVVHAAGTILESVCLPADAAGSVTHQYTLIHTDAQTTYTVGVSAPEARAAVLEHAWTALLQSLTPAGK